MRKAILFLTMMVLVFGLYLLVTQSPAQAQSPNQGENELNRLGKALFFDANLSVNKTQSCASCHSPEAGFTGPDSRVNETTVVYHGAVGERFGNRKPPSSEYAGDSPVLHFDEAAGEWVGGMFWDGRATGGKLGDPLAEQAMGPFLNPLEQAIPNERLVCQRVSQSPYSGVFEQIWGAGSLNFARDASGCYERIARSIAAYERSTDAFTSKFDLFWDTAQAAGKDVTRIKWPGGGRGGMNDPYRWQAYRGYGLSDTELQGLAAFNDPNRANCASCHSLQPGSNGYPLFTDFGYANIGLPRNPDNPFYGMPAKWNPDGAEWVDYGLGGFLQSAGFEPEIYTSELGKFKVPSLRNVDKRPSDDFVKAYGHNGFFKSLEDIIHFYAWRGMVQNGCMEPGMGGGGMGGGGMGEGMTCEEMQSLFPIPEVDQNLAPMQHFSMMDQANILAFLKTLTDGYFER